MKKVYFLIFILQFLSQVFANSQTKMEPLYVEEPFYSCVESLKRKMLNDYDFWPKNPVYHSHSAIKNTFDYLRKQHFTLKKSRSKKVKYESSKRKNRYESLNVNTEFSEANSTFKYEVKLSDVGSKKEKNRLQLKIEMKRFLDDQLVSDFEAEFTYDYQNKCQQEIVKTTVSSLDYFKNKIDSSLVVKKTSHEIQHKNQIASLAETSESETHLPLCPSGRDDIFKKLENEEFHCFDPEIMLEQSIRVEDREVIQGYDPVIGQVADFERTKIVLKIVGLELLITEALSKGSFFSFGEIIPGHLYEEINQDLWLKTYFEKDNVLLKKEKPKNYPQLFFDKFYHLKTSSFFFDNYDMYFRTIVKKTSVDAQELTIQYGRKELESELEKIAKRTFPERYDALFQKHLEASYYYDYHDSDIQRLSEELRKKFEVELSQGERIQAILSTVTKHLSYDPMMVEGDSVTFIRASDALKRKSGVCQHFSALFVALSRSLGIPSRQIMGFHGGNEYHAWVEVLVDGKTWLPLEPQVSALTSLRSLYLPIIVNELYESKQLNDLKSQLKLIPTKRFLEELKIKTLDQSDVLLEYSDDALLYGH